MVQASIPRHGTRIVLCKRPLPFKLTEIDGTDSPMSISSEIELK
jgi:hypothetical protein